MKNKRMKLRGTDTHPAPQGSSMGVPLRTTTISDNLGEASSPYAPSRGGWSVNDHDRERWVGLYKAAVFELERSLVAGRIANARTEILMRVEALCQIPGLHDKEQRAIEDALSHLRSLEREDADSQTAQESGSRLGTIAHDSRQPSSLTMIGRKPPTPWTSFAMKSGDGRCEPRTRPQPGASNHRRRPLW
jgi:hypothetical protein